jgi:UDP:flavonoid glycosyltransferase YjiC (YdhE family)
MSKILIFPWPEPGHILPTLPVTRHLASLGHEVTYLTAPQFDFEITAVGGKVESIFPKSGDTARLSGSSLWYRFALDYGRDSRASRLREQIRGIVGSGDFSLILCDHRLGRNFHRFMADLTGDVRLASFSTSLFDWNGPFEWGIPTLVFCPEAFELDNFRKQQSGVFYVEPSLSPIELETDISNIPLSDFPLVVVSFGTQSIRYRHMFDPLPLIEEIAKRQPRLQFVISTGRYKTYEQTGDIAQLPNVTIRRHISQRNILQRASAFITHGGCGSIKEAIYAGVPQVVLPMLYDQPFNAMRVRHHNLGDAVFPEKQSPDIIESVICDAIDGKYRTQLESMRSVFIAMETEHISHRLLDKWLHNSWGLGKQMKSGRYV